MSALIDMTGKQCGYLTVIGRVAAPEHIRSKFKEAYWLCRCACGNETIVRGRSLREGETVSCGCMKGLIVGKKLQTHGESRIGKNFRGSSLYHRWQSMKNAKNVIGIKTPVCDEWQDFYVFSEWARSHGYNDKFFISRIDHNYGWFPENVCITMKRKHTNKTKTNFIIPNKGKDGKRKMPDVD